MAYAGNNYLAVVLAAVASFLFGGIWYGMLADRWMAAANVTPEFHAAVKSGNAIRPYVVALLALLLMALFLSGLLGLVGGGHITVVKGLISGAAVWLGFVVTSLTVNHAFQGAKPELTLIDGGHWLGVLLVQGTILGWFGAG